MVDKPGDLAAALAELADALDGASPDDITQTGIDMAVQEMRRAAEALRRQHAAQPSDEDLLAPYKSALRADAGHGGDKAAAPFDGVCLSQPTPAIAPPEAVTDSAPSAAQPATPEPVGERGPWTCFFCGETFTDVACAKQHFGNDLLSLAVCEIKAQEGGLVKALRDAEDQLGRYRAEDSDTDRAMYAMQSDHRQALVRAEETGYNKGVQDMKQEAEADLTCLRAEVDGWKADAERESRNVTFWRGKLTEAEAEVERKDAALRWYAEADRYDFDNDCCWAATKKRQRELSTTDMNGDVLQDEGERARAALSAPATSGEGETS